MTDETNRGGRPPKPPSEKQSAKIMVTFTPGELREVKRQAGAKPLGTWIRELVLRSLARRRKRH